MKKIIAAAALGLAAWGLAACGQSTAPTTATETAAATPTGLMEQSLAKSPEERPVFAWQLLTAYQTAHPEVTPVCRELREAAARGVVPADVAEGSVYQPFAGALIYSIQCGPRLTTVRADAHEHWLVVLPPGAPEATIVSCADPRGDDMCVMPIPRAAAAATGTSSAPH